MADDQLAYYAYTRIELTQRFLDKYRHRQKQAKQMTEVQELPQTDALVQAPSQPVLSEKDQKNLRKEIQEIHQEQQMLKGFLLLMLMEGSEVERKVYGSKVDAYLFHFSQLCHMKNDDPDFRRCSVQVREAAIKIIKPHIEKITKFDALKWSQYSDEELIADKRERALFVLNCSLAQGYLKKADRSPKILC